MGRSSPYMTSTGCYLRALGSRRSLTTSVAFTRWRQVKVFPLVFIFFPFALLWYLFFSPFKSTILPCENTTNVNMQLLLSLLTYALYVNA